MLYKKMKASKKSKIKGAQFYKVGDKVETIRTDVGAWFTADIIDILPNSKCECYEECQCTYKLLFECIEDDDDDDVDDIQVVDRKLSEIRQVTYSSINWGDLKVGMKVVINYNISKPKQWGYWYDYVIEDIQKRNDVYYLKGSLLVGFDGSTQKVSVSIDSDNVADVLEIRPHATLKEKEMDCYETGVKPEYCSKCKNKPKVKCRTCCCCKCGIKKDFEMTVQCDECADWYHFYCIKPPLDELPEEEDWYCPNCNNETQRAKLEMKQTVKNQKKELSNLKKSPLKKKQIVRKLSKNPVKYSNEIKTAVSVQKDNSDQEVEMKEIPEGIPEGREIWNQIKEFFPEYDLIHVTVEVIRKKAFHEGKISPAAEEIIGKDVANKHLWQEAKESLAQGKEVFLEAVKRIFTCAICCDLLNDPITLSCKHNFCIDCFFRSLSVNVYNCSLCRVDVIHTQHYIVNENLKRALALLFEKKITKKNDI